MFKKTLLYQYKRRVREFFRTYERNKNRIFDERTCKCCGKILSFCYNSDDCQVASIWSSDENLCLLCDYKQNTIKDTPYIRIKFVRDFIDFQTMYEKYESQNIYFFEYSLPIRKSNIYLTFELGV